MTDPWFADDFVTVYHGDSLDILKELPDASIDAVVTDPPYGLVFMGKHWDDHVDNTQFGKWCEQWAAECLRVLKPGGHMLAFGGTRTWHRLACAVEDAGFEIRDTIAWLYGSGFPKSLDVSKAIDKAAGAEREVVGVRSYPTQPNGRSNIGQGYNVGETAGTEAGNMVTVPATADAQKWAGWGTALKPAHEPIVVARKPLTGTVAGNVLAHGTGALNIDATRIAGEPWAAVAPNSGGRSGGVMGKPREHPGGEPHAGGRWPANVVLDPAAAQELDRQSGIQRDGIAVNRNRGDRKPSDVPYVAAGANGPDITYGGEGGASRFFKVTKEDNECSTPRTADDGQKSTAEKTGKGGDSTTSPPITELAGARFRYTAKANTAERPRVARDGAGEGRVIDDTIKRCGDCGNPSVDSNGLTCGHTNVEYVKVQRREEHIAHPTVKPLDLMRWLVRLVTPKGGVVLDPFLGSGTTVEACVIEGFRCVGVERESDYLPLIRARLTKPIQPDLFG